MTKKKQKIHIGVDENDIAFCYIWLEKFHPTLKHLIKYRVDFDFESRPMVECRNWYIHDWGYAFSPILVNGVERKGIYMHRQVVQEQLLEGQAKGLNEVDHIDWNKLNNRKNNLKVTNRSGNASNKPSRSPFGWEYIQTIHSKLYQAYAPADTPDEPAIFLGEFETRAEAIESQYKFKEALSQIA